MFSASRALSIRAVRAFMSTEIVNNANTKEKKKNSFPSLPNNGLTQTTTATAADAEVATAQRLTDALLAQHQQRRTAKQAEEKEARRHRTARAPAAQTSPRANALHDMPSDRSLAEIQAGFTASYGRSALLTADCHAYETKEAHVAKAAEEEASGDDNKSAGTDTFLKNINSTWEAFSPPEKMEFVCMTPQGRQSARALEAMMAKRRAHQQQQSNRPDKRVAAAAALTKRGGRRNKSQNVSTTEEVKGVERKDRLSRLLRHYAAAGARQRKVKSPRGIHEQPSVGSPQMEAVLRKLNRSGNSITNTTTETVLTPAFHAFNETKRKNELRKRSLTAKEWEEQWSSLLPASAAGMFQQLKKGHIAEAPLDLKQNVSFKSQAPPITEDFVRLCNEFRMSSPRKAYVMRRLFSSGAATETPTSLAGGEDEKAAEGLALAAWRARAQQFSDEYDAHLAQLRAKDAEQAQTQTAAASTSKKGKSAVDTFKEALLEEEVEKLKNDINTFAHQLPFLEAKLDEDYGKGK